MDLTYKYPLDLTGLAKTNKIQDEVHEIPTDGKIIVPAARPYFTNSLKVLHVESNIELVHGKDFLHIQMSTEASVETGQECCHSFRLLDNTLVGTVKIEYQTIGGPYVSNYDNIVASVDNMLKEQAIIGWHNITGKPKSSLPTRHLLNGKDVVGQSEVVDALSGIERAIISDKIYLPPESVAAFAKRMDGLEERRRLANLDIFSRQLFFQDSFRILKVGEIEYSLTPGHGYVAGIRIGNSGQLITVTESDVFVYLDVYTHTDFINESEIVVTVILGTDGLGDYVDDSGYQHYVEKIAEIKDGCVHDLRMAISVDSFIDYIDYKLEDIKCSIGNHERNTVRRDTVLNEVQRKNNEAVLGRSLFYNDCCSVDHISNESYIINEGTGCIAGIYFEIKERLIDVNNPTAYVAADVYLDSTDLLNTDPKVIFRVYKDLNDIIDYVDGNNIQHYVEAVARVRGGKNIDDLREWFGSKLNIVDIVKRLEWLEKPH